MISGRSRLTDVGSDRVLEPGVDLLRHRGSADQVPALEHHDAQPGPGKIGRVDEPVVSAPDDDRVIPVGGRHGVAPLPVGVEERGPRHRGPRSASLVLDRHLDLKLGSDVGEVRAQVREPQIGLEGRRPAPARGVPDLAPAGVERNAVPERHPRQLGRQAHLRVRVLERLPVERDPAEAPCGGVGPFGAEGRPAHEVRRLQRHGPAQPEFVRRRLLVLDDRALRGYVVDVDEQQTGLEARHVERQQARRSEAERFPRRRERVPERDRVLGVHPDLVPEVARVPGARDPRANPGDPRRHDAEIAKSRHVRVGDPLEHIPRQRPLERERPQPLRLLLEFDIEPPRVLVQPLERRFRRGEPEIGLTEPLERPVVPNLARPVAPRSVVHLPHRLTRDIPRHDAIRERFRPRAREPVLVERGDIDERGRRANGLVFVLVRGLVRTRGEVTGPTSPIRGLTEGTGPFVEGGPAQDPSRGGSQSGSRSATSSPGTPRPPTAVTMYCTPSCTYVIGTPVW